MLKSYKKFIAFLTVGLTVLAVGATTSVNCGSVQAGKQRHYMRVTVDYIDNSNTDGVSRVACTLVGVPHTSSRIDSIHALVGGRLLRATDIDGVDFSRYFQWEDDGAVPVEIDIERVNRVSPADSLKVYTVHGIYTAPLKNVRIKR